MCRCEGEAKRNQTQEKLNASKVPDAISGEKYLPEEEKWRCVAEEQLLATLPALVRRERLSNTSGIRIREYPDE